MKDSENPSMVKRLNSGDEQAYREVYEQWHRRLYSFAYQYVKSRVLAEDAVHDAFVKLWVHREKLESSVQGFLFTTVRNLILNMIRNDKRRLIKQVELEITQRASSSSTEEVVLYSEYLRIVEKGISTLTDRQREVFELKSRAGLSNQEVAESLGISLPTVKSHYHDASRQIRKYLSDHAGIDSGTGK